jgi:hypothetical protein
VYPGVADPVKFTRTTVPLPEGARRYRVTARPPGEKKPRTFMIRARDAAQAINYLTSRKFEVVTMPVEVKDSLLPSPEKEQQRAPRKPVNSKSPVPPAPMTEVRPARAASGPPVKVLLDPAAVAVVTLENAIYWLPRVEYRFAPGGDSAGVQVGNLSKPPFTLPRSRIHQVINARRQVLWQRPSDDRGGRTSAFGKSRQFPPMGQPGGLAGREQWLQTARTLFAITDQLPPEQQSAALTSLFNSVEKRVEKVRTVSPGKGWQGDQMLVPRERRPETPNSGVYPVTVTFSNGTTTPLRVPATTPTEARDTAAQDLRGLRFNRGGGVARIDVAPDPQAPLTRGQSFRRNWVPGGGVPVGPRVGPAR